MFAITPSMGCRYLGPRLVVTDFKASTCDRMCFLRSVADGLNGSKSEVREVPCGYRVDLSCSLLQTQYSDGGWGER